ncbi:hypothetical protein HELRODRAFT_188355 [Helobdella robusta]|uniref:AGC-kinase C-terminal domain-containing protein n=1 Tax=Helobdella robusta TaxID=6412 RepID=T1FPX0_HELRO|nr:hypothetical protein HELRODRAFT_188355 [Helobdella robusta]ESO06417.1 hypothetical protein HELRODRAFT_188355 [Helobdella robusta]
MNYKQKDETDVSQFDPKFTKQMPIDSPVDSKLSESCNQLFMGFTYVAPSILEEMTKPWLSVKEPRSHRKLGSFTMRDQHHNIEDINESDDEHLTSTTLKDKNSITNHNGAIKINKSRPIPVSKSAVFKGVKLPFKSSQNFDNKSTKPPFFTTKSTPTTASTSASSSGKVTPVKSHSSTGSSRSNINYVETLLHYGNGKDSKQGNEKRWNFSSFVKSIKSPFNPKNHKAKN